jgi:ParB-like nuclease domain
MDIKTLTAVSIDSELQSLVAPLSTDEFEMLQAQIIAQGCLTPLIVWKTDAGEKILLDGHNRHEICTKNGISFSTRNVKLADRDHAKLWILEHQAGRRNLTDDQRAVVWNEIREQRSKIAQAEKLQRARDIKLNSISVKITEIEQPVPVEPIPEPKAKIDTRTLVAKEAKLPENKLRQAQVLKKHQPALYEQVLAGRIKLRDTKKLQSKAGLQFDKPFYKQAGRKLEFYNQIGRKLASVFNGIDERLRELSHIKKRDWCPETEEGLKRLLLNLDEVTQQTEKYRQSLKKVLKANR